METVQLEKEQRHRYLIADHVLPLACVDDFEVDREEGVVEVRRRC
jgi:hypothetical protein